MAISTNGTIITRLAGALYGEYLSNASYTEVKETAAVTVAADMIKNDFAGKTDAQLATTILKNLDLTTVAGLDNWVAAQLTAAGSTAAAKGAKLVEMLNGYANMTADATYGASATSFNAKVEASLVLSQTTGTKAGAFGTANAASNQTITLTADLETVEGGAANDRFIASYGSTLDSGDSIVGGDGTDTLSISVTGSDVTAETITILASGIEKITIANTETDTDDVIFDLASAGSSVATVGTYASTAAGDTSFTNVGSIVAIEAAGKGDVSVSYASGVTSGAADTQSITLNGAGTSSSSRATITSSGIETINLASNGSSNFITITNSSLKTLNVTGSKALTVSNTSAFLTTVDASASSGALTLLEPAATNITVTGGTGNDKLRIDGSSISTSDSVNVGDGLDTLELTVASNVGSAAAGAVLKGFEQVYGYRSIDGAPADLTVSQNVSYISGVTTLGTSSWTVADEEAEADDDTADGVSFTGLTSSVTDLKLSGISYETSDTAEGGFSFTATVAMGTDTTSDSLNITVGSTSAAAFTATSPLTDSFNVSATDYETLTINSQGAANTIATLTAGDLAKLTVNASKALTITSIASVTGAFKTIDASASTENVSIGTAIQGAGTVLGGAGNDTLTGSAYADSIDGGAGNDSLTSGGGNDTINGGDGNDEITNGSTTTSNKVSIAGGAGDDTIIGGTGNDTMVGGEGNDVFAFAWSDAESGEEAGDDSISSFATLTSADVITGGDGTDTLRVTGTVIDNDTLDLSASSLTALSGVTGIERLQWNGDDDTTETTDSITIKLGDIALGSFSNDLTVTFGTAVDYSAGVDASLVYNSASKITASAATGQTFTYTVGNGLDSVTGGTESDTFVVTNNVFWGTNDVVKGGAGNDTLSLTDDNGGTLTAKLATMSSVETVSINTTDAGGVGRITLVLSDAIVAANYDTSGNKFTVTRDDEDTGTLSVDASSVSSTYHLVLTGASGANSTTGGGDTLIGGAGNDTITGGDGSPDVVTLTAGGTDSVRFTSLGDGGDAVDTISGFTTYTVSAASTAVVSGYDKIVFTYDAEAEGVFAYDTSTTAEGLAFDETDDTEAAIGAVVTLLSDDYTEITGLAPTSAAAATSGLLAVGAVNVIKSTGYASLISAVESNAEEEADEGTGIVIFYNTSSMATEMYYVSDFGADGDEDAAGTLLATFSDVTLTGLGGFSADNFAIEYLAAV